MKSRHPSSNLTTVLLASAFCTSTALLVPVHAGSLVVPLASAALTPTEALAKAESVVALAKTKAMARDRIRAHRGDTALSREDALISILYAQYAEDLTDEQWEIKLREAAFADFLANSPIASVAPLPVAPVVPVNPLPLAPVAPVNPNQPIAPINRDQPATTAIDTAKKIDPQKQSGFKVDAGYAMKFGKGRSSEPYYRLEYQGKELKKKGNPITSTDVNGNSSIGDDTTIPVPADPGNDSSGGDSKAFSFRLENGTTKSSGALFDALGVKENIFGSDAKYFRNLRGVAQITGNSQGDQINFAAGLEAPPIHPLSLIGLNKEYSFTDYLIPGLVGEKQLLTTSGGANENSLVATYRSFIGKASGYELDKKFQKKLIDKVLEIGPDRDRAIAYVAANPLTELPAEDDEDEYLKARAVDLLRIITDPEFSVPADWQAAVRQFAQTEGGAMTHPSSAYWLENAGWYRFQNDVGPHYGNLLAATATFWLNPSEGSTKWIRLRYEWGRERAEPTVKKNQLALTLGADF